MGKLLVLIGFLLLGNAIWLLMVGNPHLGHYLQMTLALGLVGYGYLFRKVPKLLRRIIGFLSLIPILIMVFLAGYGNYRTVDFQEDVLLVLGAGLLDDQISASLERRLNVAVEYFQHNPQVKIIVCGGLGERQSITEAEAMERFLVEHGVPLANIVREDQSTSTFENLLFARELFPEGSSVALITNDFHIFRATALAHELGIEVNRMGASTPISAWMLNYLREVVAVVDLWLFR
jgi:uncharacterized SAM-binding protein YcdF (DUF218 family)